MNLIASAQSGRQRRMIELIKRLAPSDGYAQSLLDGVTFMRSNKPLAITPVLYEPSIVIVVQGRKRGFYGDKMYVYDADNYLVLSVPLPFSIETEASASEPLLGIVLRIDPVATAALAMELDHEVSQPTDEPVSLYASPIEDKLADACLRLLEALSSPEEARLLGPSIEREISYRVLNGGQGGALRAALRQEGKFYRIARVLRLIHKRYAERLDVTSLAHEANMSVPAFHVHFKEVAQTSPIQYIKAIRLHEARLMMIRNDINAVTAADKVGYESSSQFSREFKRLFGRSPLEEARHLKASLSLSAPVNTPFLHKHEGYSG